MPMNTQATPAGTSTHSAHLSRLDVADALLALLRESTTEPRPDTQLEALTLAVAADLPVLRGARRGSARPRPSHNSPRPYGFH